MKQFSLFADKAVAEVVNVASVPQRSPFRYPGGKTWLVPRIRQWLRATAADRSEFIEPFAGGGIISLTVAFEELCQHVTMVEIDEEVAAVWKTIIAGDANWLAERIESFHLTAETVRLILANCDDSLRDKAFRTILRNRVLHGGILAAGSSLMKRGENGKGIGSRWYPKTLARRIRDIMRVRNRIRFIQGDGMEVIRENAHRADAVFFLDPPYTAAGKKAGTRLYTHHTLDHEELFRMAATISGDFLMTYDNAPEIERMAHRHGFDSEVVPMKSTHHAVMTELLIGRNLDWCR